LFPLLAKPQKLPVTRLARQVDLFHLVITDNQRLETLSLPHGLAPPIKPITHFSQATALCNKSFFPTHGVVFIWRFLTTANNDKHCDSKLSNSGDFKGTAWGVPGVGTTVAVLETATRDRHRDSKVLTGAI
jgi:hypothetical protein